MPTLSYCLFCDVIKLQKVLGMMPEDRLYSKWGTPFPCDILEINLVESWFRITVGTQEENYKLVKGLTSVTNGVYLVALTYFSKEGFRKS